MSSEKEFKDKLKDKLGNKEFQFDEANWEQARNLIDASREEKKRVILPYILFGLFFIGSGILGFYVLNTGENIANKGMAVNAINNMAPGIKTPTIIPEETKEGRSTSNKEIKNAITSDTKQLAKEETVAKKENAIKKIDQEKNITTSERKINDTEKTGREKNVTTSESKKTKQLKNNIAVATVNERSKKHKEEPAIVASTKENKNSDPQIAKEKTIKNNDQENANETVTAIPAINNTESVKNEAPEAASTNTVKTGPLAETKPTISAAVDSAAKTLAIETITAAPTHFISIEAGTNYLFGWNNPGKKDANGFNPVIGLNYSNIIAKKTILSFGIQYTQVRNLSYSNYVVTTTHYNFGEESDVMIFTPATLHYLVAPIRLSYSVNSKNTFGMACNIGYLFNVGSNVEVYSQHAGQKSNSTVLKTLGYTHGFKTFDTQLSVFYRRNLAKDLWLHTEFMYGLTDIKDNAFFRSNVKEKNVGLKITLIYNLFKK